MKKAIKTLWHGIKAVFTAIVDWVATLFGMKDNSKYGRVLHRVVSTAFALLVIFWAVTALVRFGRSIYWNISSSYGYSDRYSSIQLSETFNDNLFYYHDYWGDKGYLADSNGHKVLKHILCINKPLEGDSLVYFSDGDKRGYFHMRDGRLVVKPVYEHAWIFSDGLAAVEAGGRIKFIDTEGRVAIDRGFKYDECDDGYVFHEGHCAANDSEGMRMGLIDRKGDWVLPPIYKNIYPQDTFWLLRTDDRMALLTFELDTVIPLVASSLYVDDSIVKVTFPDHTQSTFDLQGNLLAANLIRDVDQLMYDTREVMYRTGRDLNEETETYYSYDDYTNRKAVATCLRYEAEGGWYGLMSSDGRQLTKPMYSSIEAIDKDLYLCETTYGHGVILNSKGQRVE